MLRSHARNQHRVFYNDTNDSKHEQERKSAKLKRKVNNNRKGRIAKHEITSLPMRFSSDLRWLRSNSVCTMIDVPEMQQDE